jgi:hypothetical protein
MAMSTPSHYFLRHPLNLRHVVVLKDLEPVATEISGANQSVKIVIAADPFLR